MDKRKEQFTERVIQMTQMSKRMFHLSHSKKIFFKIYTQELPVGPVVQILPSNAGGVGSVVGQAAWSHMPHDQKTKT